MIRILFLDTRPIRRGAQVFVHELKQKLSNEGMPVKRIFLYEEHQYEQLLLNQEDIVMPFSENHVFEKIPTVQPLLVTSLAKEIRLFNPDIILCNGSRTLKYAAILKKFYPSIKCKWVYRVIDSAVYWNRRSITQFYYRNFVIPAMDGAVGVSHASLAQMIAHYDFKKPSVCIPRAIDVEYFSQYLPDNSARENAGISKDAFVILFLGNFTSQKRPDRFVNIIHALKKLIPNVHGLMVGNGSLKAKIEEQVNMLGIEDIITYAGYQRDVRPWISMSNVLLLTSDTEGMPGVVLEAAAMKKIAIVSNVGGVGEFIVNGECGFLVEENDLKDFINYVYTLFSNNHVFKMMEISAYEKVKSNYNMSNISTAYKMFLTKIYSI